MSISANPHTGNPPRSTPAVTLAEDRADAETELVVCILACPRLGATIAIEAGIVPADVDQPDLRLLFCAAEIAAEDNLDKPSTLRLARLALQADGFWDPSQIAGNALTSMYHSDGTLARLATCRSFCPTSIKQAARALLHIIARQAAAAYQEAA